MLLPLVKFSQNCSQPLLVKTLHDAVRHLSTTIVHKNYKQMTRMSQMC